MSTKKRKTKKPPELSPAQIERLALLSEELGAAQKAVGKILRHGYESGWNGSNNREDLTHEIGDVLYAIALLRYAEDLDGEPSPYIAEKAVNVQRFMHHQPRKLLERVERECSQDHHP